MKEGLGKARTWNSRFDSRKLAWSSITAVAISLLSDRSAGNALAFPVCWSQRFDVYCVHHGRIKM